MSSAPRQDDEWGPELGGAVDVKWSDATPGDELIGTWQGVRTEGKYPAGLLEVDGVTKKIAFPAVLQRVLTPLPLGSRVRIVYCGQAKGPTGVAYHNFKVYPSKRTAVPPAPAPRQAVPSNPNDEEVDF